MTGDGVVAARWQPHMPCYSDAASASKVWADVYRGVQLSWVFALLVSITTEVRATCNHCAADGTNGSRARAPKTTVAATAGTRTGRDPPHRGIDAVVDPTQQRAGDLAKRRQVASDTRRFHPARMHALHTDVAAFQPSRPRVGQHDLHLLARAQAAMR